MRNLEIKNNDSLASYEREPVRTLLPESGLDVPAVLSAVYTDSTPAKNRQSDAPQYGRSMIEMLGVLAIIGVLSVGGIAGYSKAMMKYRINKTIEQISLITANIRSFYAPQKGGIDNDGGTVGKYYGLSKTILQKAKLVPDEIWNEDKTTMENAFGGNIEISDAVDEKNLTGGTFVVGLKKVPEESCIELLTHAWPEDFEAIDAGNLDAGRNWVPLAPRDCVTDQSGFGEGYAYACKVDGTIPVDIDKATQACICPTENLCSLYFYAK